ncbi:cell division protein ZapC [Vibrio vulnificus]|uniref:cell division protein ZapC n=1 Tax=Vibrio vulnificus TaxID=672 RepID=UPI0002D7FE1C|nr:cell division protein ZapC [Vibrio vulnificus]AUL95564.1 cell division protein ZapC [Vibrio vulnificus]EGQ7982756.1 cell division protein ZapC [Vibrio vulnificus]EGQ8076978.1 cell division protein ZapC [Vibrio vulnificus]EHH0794699.1 cell division protein ZapC [Vibrio vulnificus]EHH1179957.1 cell division protein ZapC [Vibrio vulnificus]
MLKPSDKWSWYFDKPSGRLMLDLGDRYLFQTNLSDKLLVDCAFSYNDFTVDDASAFQTFKECLSSLDLSEYRRDELTLYCVAAKRFHKPVQPKSWFFHSTGSDYQPSEGELVQLQNGLNQGLFIVLEAGDNASLVNCVELEGFMLSSSKSLSYGEAIKVMHDRMSTAARMNTLMPMALVG